MHQTASINNINKRRGLLFILSSPAGAGKTSLANRLNEEDSELELSVSTTTRPPRNGEINGKHYNFIDRATFETQRSEGEFLEWAEVFGNLYGTPKTPIEAALTEGRDVISDIDWQGAQKAVKVLPNDVVPVFLLPPSRQTQIERLRTRATDSDEVLARRLAGSAEEISHWEEYDYVLVNDDFETTLTSLRHILSAERLKRKRRLGLASLVQELLHSG
ncbi:MAG: guanylate kinase [Alphaproteobacteria bacterium]